MDQSSEFKQCSDELNQLRMSFLQAERNKSDAVVKSTTQMAQNQLSGLQTINDFFYKFSTTSGLKERLEDDKSSIVMPGRQAVLDFINIVKSAVEIHKEGAVSVKNEGAPDMQFVAKEKANLNKLSYVDLSNREFNKCFRSMGNYYSAPLENEELGDSTVNTIVSEDVWASSPI